jgi:hypothetical protein
MKTFIGIKPVHHFKAAVFEVPTSLGNVYMSVSRTNYLNEERAVVEVDGHRFFELWKSEPNSIHAGQAHGSDETWRNDRKFEDAAKGFSFGEVNPVPLAEVNCNVYTKAVPIRRRSWLLFQKTAAWNQVHTPYIAFTNGVTRTIWLAAHKAERFPVECDIKQAPRLHQLAGAPGSRWLTVAELLPAEAARG